MSIELPAVLEKELNEYASAAHLSPNEAAAQLIQKGLVVSRPASPPRREVTDADIDLLRSVGLLGLFEDASDEELDQLSAYIAETKLEDFEPRS